MKIWRSYGSAHSARLTVVGEFENIDDAQLAEQVVEDYVNAGLEKRYPDAKAFNQAWQERIPAVIAIGPHKWDFENFIMTSDDVCETKREDTTVTVSHIRTAEIGGIIKLMLLKDPTEIKVTGRTGP